jgi:hypothetical protein
MVHPPVQGQPAPTDSERRRATAKELRERVEIVRRKLVTGETRDAIRLLITAEWGLRSRQARWYLQKAEGEIRDAAQRSKDAWLAEHIAIRRDIRRRANHTGDLRAELAAAESEAKLLGLEPPTKLEHFDSGPTVTEIVIQHHIPVDGPATDSPDDGTRGHPDCSGLRWPSGIPDATIFLLDAPKGTQTAGPPTGGLSFCARPDLTRDLK